MTRCMYILGYYLLFFLQTTVFMETIKIMSVQFKIVLKAVQMHFSENKYKSFNKTNGAVLSLGLEFK